MKFGHYEKSAVAVLCQEPRLGQVKTRLAPALGPKWALDFYRACLSDTFALASASENAQFFACLPPSEATGDNQTSDTQTLGEFLGAPNLEFLRPVAGDLGARIEGALSELFSRGFGKVAVLTADLPDLPGARLRRTWEILETDDFVFGPSRDGGFYLMAAKNPPPSSLFDRVDWNGEKILRQIEGNLAKENGRWRWSRLPFWNGIEDESDLKSLKTRLQLGAKAERVREFLASENF